MSVNLVGYSIVYKDRLGEYITTFDNIHNFEYTKKESDFGSFAIDLPPIYPLDFFQTDGQIEIYRQVGAYEPYLELDTKWLIRLARYKYSNGEQFIHLLAHDLTSIVDRRIVAYPCGSSYTEKNMNADDMMIQIWRENFGDLCTDTTRDISSYVGVDTGSANSIAEVIEDSFCRQKVLPLFQDLCERSINANKYLAFDIICNLDGKPVFKVFNGSRGVDRGEKSGNKFSFSVDIGNLEYATYTKDHTNEFNYIYAGGSGKDDTRIIATASDSVAINSSPINRIEDFISASDEDSVAVVQKEANTRLAEAKAKIAINTHIIQTPESLYGVNYNFGDIVNITIGEYSMDVHLDTINVTVDSTGEETVKIFGRNLDEGYY